jgi:hypothetical protein
MSFFNYIEYSSRHEKYSFMHSHCSHDYYSIVFRALNIQLIDDLVYIDNGTLVVDRIKRLHRSTIYIYKWISMPLLGTIVIVTRWRHIFDYWDGDTAHSRWNGIVDRIWFVILFINRRPEKRPEKIAYIRARSVPLTMASNLTVIFSNRFIFFPSSLFFRPLFVSRFLRSSFTMQPKFYSHTRREKQDRQMLLRILLHLSSRVENCCQWRREREGRERKLHTQVLWRKVCFSWKFIFLLMSCNIWLYSLSILHWLCHNDW